MAWTHTHQEQREVPSTEHMEIAINLSPPSTPPGTPHSVRLGQWVSHELLPSCIGALSSAFPGACAGMLYPITDFEL